MIMQHLPFSSASELQGSRAISRAWEQCFAVLSPREHGKTLLQACLNGFGQEQKDARANQQSSLGFVQALLSSASFCRQPALAPHIQRDYVHTLEGSLWGSNNTQCVPQSNRTPKRTPHVASTIQ